jgi:hypothetical protein
LQRIAFRAIPSVFGESLPVNGASTNFYDVTNGNDGICLSLAGKTIMTAAFDADGRHGEWMFQLSPRRRERNGRPYLHGRNAPLLTVGPLGQSVASASYSIVPIVLLSLYFS